MKRYKVWVRLEVMFDKDEAIEAETEDEAFLEASNMAITGGAWDWDAEEMEECDEE